MVLFLSYQAISIQKIASMIGNNEVYLPAIQRKFVWKTEQIERFFDSVMLGYPIGTFLFWNVEKKAANDYTFYKFLSKYHERDNYLNEKAPKPEMKENIIGVLDGQQRLSSLYLALQGTYSYKTPRARWDNDEAFPNRELYFNVLKNSKNENDSVTYSFKFLTLSEKEKENENENEFWVPVKIALLWRGANDPINYAREIGLLNSNVAIDNLTLLWQRITQDKVINYFEVINNNLDDILDIFIRVNSGGAVLSKSDLLFSTIVANWEEGREEIEELLKSLNSKGEGFSFDNDFIMRTCLVLMDSPVLFNVKNFKAETVLKIKKNWEEIKISLLNVSDFLVEFGFSKENLISRNAIIPIVYHVYKGGEFTGVEKIEFRKYLITSLLKQIFGGKGDQVLESIRSFMREKKESEFNLKNQKFTFNNLKQIKLPADKTFEIDDEDIEEIFTYKKGSYTFMVLSLMYPQLKLSQIKFHQDHIHPVAYFNKKTFSKYNLSEQEQKEWLQFRDTVANLQLLVGKENISKKDTPFISWLENEDNQVYYKKSNYIPEVQFEFENFKEFYLQRKILLIEEFKKVIE